MARSESGVDVVGRHCWWEDEKREGEMRKKKSEENLRPIRYFSSATRASPCSAQPCATMA